MIKYLGSKRTLIPHVLEAVASAEGATTVLDLFSGTGRVGHALKAAGYRVLASDHNAYAATLARCYVQADLDLIRPDALRLLEELNALTGKAGYITETYSIRSRFFQPKNGERIDVIREKISEWNLEPELEAVLLVSLLEAADRVDSTTGVQMAYLKSWAPRSYNDLELRLPDVLPRAKSGKGEAHCLDAFDAAEQLPADVAYIDPPYNQHSYLGNYHIWESLVRWDRPDVYGVACKRVDCRTRRSVFNSRPRFRSAMERILRTVRAETLVISFSNEGYLTREEMEELVAAVFAGSSVDIVELDYKRYVGAQIGIFNPRGEKVGRVGHLRNKEYLYVVRTRGGDSARHRSTSSIAAL